MPPVPTMMRETRETMVSDIGAKMQAKRPSLPMISVVERTDGCEAGRGR